MHRSGRLRNTRTPRVPEAIGGLQCHRVPGARDDTPAALRGSGGRTPDAIAVVFGDQELGYAELNARSNRLANHLISVGVGPEALVGVYLERSAEMMVAPPGNSQGGRRLRSARPWLSGSPPGVGAGRRGPAWVLSSVSLLGRLPAAMALDAPETEAALRQASASDPVDRERTAPLRPANLAYVIHTSGSAGAPKGGRFSPVPDESPPGDVRGPGLSSRDTLLAVTSLSFDIAAPSCSCRTRGGEG